VNGLGVARSLAAIGVPVAVVSTRSFDVAQHSRAVVERCDLPGFHQEPECLIELLERHAARWHGWAVFPTNDDAVAVLAQHHERLSTSYRLTVPPWGALRPLVEKDAMHALAADVGLDLPRCFGEAVPGVEPAGVRYPAIVKPTRHDSLIERCGVKLFVARGAAELRVAAEQIRGAGVRGLVYEFVPGPDSEIFVSCVYMDARGEPRAAATVRKLRQNPPVIGGARVAEITSELPELCEASVELLRRADFRGMAFVEFKRDPSGRFRFIEANGRAVLFNRLPARAGVDLVQMAWSDYALGEAPSARANGWRGAWIDLPSDVFATLFLRHAEPSLTFADYTAPYRGRFVPAVWSTSDPKPFLAQLAHALRSATAAASSAEARRTWARRLRPGAPSPPGLTH
jgi:predicted ATP-grasp superfamily ATP-dependent carboligase